MNYHIYPLPAAAEVGKLPYGALWEVDRICRTFENPNASWAEWTAWEEVSRQRETWLFERAALLAFNRDIQRLFNVAILTDDPRDHAECNRQYQAVFEYEVIQLWKRLHPEE